MKRIIIEDIKRNERELKLSIDNKYNIIINKVQKVLQMELSRVGYKSEYKRAQILEDIIENAISKSEVAYDINGKKYTYLELLKIYDEEFIFYGVKKIYDKIFKEEFGIDIFSSVLKYNAYENLLEFLDVEEDVIKEKIINILFKDKDVKNEIKEKYENEKNNFTLEEYAYIILESVYEDIKEDVYILVCKIFKNEVAIPDFNMSFMGFSSIEKGNLNLEDLNRVFFNKIVQKLAKNTNVLKDMDFNNKVEVLLAFLILLKEKSSYDFCSSLFFDELEIALKMYNGGSFNLDKYYQKESLTSQIDKKLKKEMLRFVKENRKLILDKNREISTLKGRITYREKFKNKLSTYLKEILFDIDFSQVYDFENEEFNDISIFYEL